MRALILCSQRTAQDQWPGFGPRAWLRRMDIAIRQDARDIRGSKFLISRERDVRIAAIANQISEEGCMDAGRPFLFKRVPIPSPNGTRHPAPSGERCG